jgi:hypothetical protein
MVASVDRSDGLVELLRLKICPGCDYSLERLPAEGVCPECGRQYDQRVAILSGLGRGIYDALPGGTWRGIAVQLVWVAFLVWFLIRRLSLWEVPQLLAWGVIALIALATQVYARFFSVRVPRMQLWLSPEGVAQIPSTPEARQAQRVTANTGWLFVPIFVIAMMIQFKAHARPIGVTLAAFVVVGAIALWWWLRRRRDVLDGENYRPRLWSWGQIEKVDVRVLPKDRARILCRIMRYWWRIAVRREWTVDIEVSCRAETAKGLERQMLRWMKGAEMCNSSRSTTSEDVGFIKSE